MKGFIKNVTRTHGGLSPCLVVDCSDGTGYTIPRTVSRSTFRDATIIVAMKNEENIYGMAKVTSFDEDKKPKTLRHLVGSQFTLEELEEIEDCRVSE